jgi:hypothetical protein
MESDSTSNSNSAASAANQEKETEAQEEEEEQEKGPQKIYIASQSGADVYYFDDEEDVVLKVGSRVREHEAVAMRLVAKHTNVPIPQINEYYCAFFPDIGFLGMSRVSGVQLDVHWDNLEDRIKERYVLRYGTILHNYERFPKPPEQEHLFQCSADGLLTTMDPLILKIDDSDPRLLAFYPNGSSQLAYPDLAEGSNLRFEVCKRFTELGQQIEIDAESYMTILDQPLTDENAILAHIYQRYLWYNGREHATDLPSILPRSSRSVFTHADLAPRNIIVYYDNDRNIQITGIVDWDAAGWYLGYWDYINI